MRLVMGSHNVRGAGALVAALALAGCGGNVRDAAQDLLDDLRDASLEWPEANVDEDGGLPDSAATDAALDSDGASEPDATQDDGSEPIPSGYCGDALLGSDERCDTSITAGNPGACPTSCTADAQNACLRAALIGTACSAHCEQTSIAACTNDDDCCANGCNPGNDDDCQAACGNGVVEGSELCDGNCPASCNDDNACTTDGATGEATSCNRVCSHTAITMCKNGDGCCAPGCNSGNDNDCSATCGNAVVDNGERCDGNCPVSCNDDDACTSDALSGTAAQCNVQCTSTAITACRDGDGCCPSSCRANNDDDCEPACGNGAVEPGEECEPSSSNDPNCSQGCLLPASECKVQAEERGEDPNDVCVECGCDSCTDELDDCYNATDVAAGGPAAGTSKATLCIAVVKCGRDSGCTGSTCYCGTASTISCGLGGGANGPCKTQIERAAESTSALTIQQRQSNTTYAVGRANAVSSCSVSNCKTQCGL
jgi:hypothetical protein